MSNALVRQISAGVAAVAATAIVMLSLNAVMANATSGDSETAPSSPALPAVVAEETVPPADPTPIPRDPEPDIVKVKAKFDPNGDDVYGLESGKVGVGVLPALRFSKDVPSKDRAAIAGNFAVMNADTGEPVAGAWAWTGEQTLQFRPEKFWKGRTTYTVTPVSSEMPLDVNEKRILQLNVPADGWSFKTARALVGYVDAGKKRMNIYVDGKKVKSFPVSLGKPGWETRSGIKVLSGSKERTKTYTSQSLGLTTETYRLTAPWNIRLTPTGEFIHAAPWAYGRIGRYNGSHGCTNMFTNDAEWVFDNTIPGDVFVYRGTSKGMESWNGPGGLWNVSEKAWTKAASKPL